MNNYEKMKAKHPMRRDIILIIVLLLLILTAIIFPRFSELREPVEKTEIIYMAPKTNMPTPREPAPDIVGSLLQPMHEKPIPPELIPDSIDFEMPVLDTFEWRSFDKYEPKKASPPPPPSKGSGIIIGGHPPYDKSPRSIGGKHAINNNIVYPDSAKRAGVEGIIVVQCHIDEYGLVQETKILKGMPGIGLDEAAMDAIKKTKWKPAVQGDRNVGVWIAIPVTFKLDK
ncbi:MAG: energy transducer TonB [Candidatus Marinimicrobia bacterium]|nr:energy transducer TonB [Candidatus Neomarinimicrobiota bacterium]